MLDPLNKYPLKVVPDLETLEPEWTSCPKEDEFQGEELGYCEMKGRTYFSSLYLPGSFMPN